MIDKILNWILMTIVLAFALVVLVYAGILIAIFFNDIFNFFPAFYNNY